MTTFQNLTINDLEEFSFIAGTKQELYFDIYDQTTGCPIDLTSGMSAYWRISPYGAPNFSVLNIVGEISGSPTNRFLVTVPSACTIDLSGKYAHQPVVIDISGNEFRPSQGIITIIPRIETI